MHFVDAMCMKDKSCQSCKILVGPAQFKFGILYWEYLLRRSISLLKHAQEIRQFGVAMLVDPAPLDGGDIAGDLSMALIYFIMRKCTRFMKLMDCEIG